MCRSLARFRFQRKIHIDQAESACLQFGKHCDSAPGKLTPMAIS